MFCTLKNKDKLIVFIAKMTHQKQKKVGVVHTFDTNT